MSDSPPGYFISDGRLIANHPHRELIHSLAVGAERAESSQRGVLRDAVSSLSTHDLAAAMDSEVWRYVDDRVKLALVQEASNRLRSLSKGKYGTCEVEGRGSPMVESSEGV